MLQTLSRYFSDFIKPIVEVHPGERAKTLLMFCYFFLIIALNWMLKPVQKSLYIDAFGAEMIKFANIGEGIFLILVVSGYMYIAKRANRKAFYYGVLWFFIFSFIGFWFLFRTQIPYLPAFFFLWQASFTITMVTAFWTLANDIFNAIEAKRLFGIMISGGSIGGIVGSLITNQVVRWIDTEDILLIAAGLLILCLFVVRILLQNIPETKHEKVRSAGPRPKALETRDSSRQWAVKLFFSSRYLVMLAAVVMIAKMASTIIDNQFSGVVENAYSGKEAMTAFFGQFGIWVNVLTFLMQFFATSMFLRYLGVGFSIWILPIGLALLSALTLLQPVLATGILFRLFDLSGNYSVQQASKEVLFLPISSTLRRRVKPIIDMLCYRLSKSFAGLYMWIFASVFTIPVEKFGWLILSLMPVWLILAWQMKRGYSTLLRHYLVRRRHFDKAVMAYRATDVLSILHDEKGFHEIKSMMHHGSSSIRKLVATACLAYAKSANDLALTRQIVSRMANEEALDKIQEKPSPDGMNPEDERFLVTLMHAGDDALKRNSAEGYLKQSTEQVLMKLGVVLRDPQKGLEPKRRAVRILERVANQEAVDLIFHTLAGARDHAFRFVLVNALNCIYDNNRDVKMNRFLIKNEVIRESKIHLKIQKIHQFYRSQRKEKSAEDYLEVALTAIQDESLERIFKYLELLYPDEMIEVIYDQIMDRTQRDPLRAHAVELLSNTLDPILLRAMQGVIEGHGNISIREDEIKDALKEFIQSDDRWFSLMGQFLVGELSLADRWPEFQEFKQTLQDWHFKN